MKKANRKRMISLVAAGAVVAGLIGGTYAAYVKTDYATNIGQGRGALALANLVENFEEKSNWKTSDPALKKEIRVENIGETSQFSHDDYVDIYTRIRLTEYMDIKPMLYEYFVESGKTEPSLFLIKRSDGLYVRFPSTQNPSVAANLAAIKASAVWADVVNGGSASKFVQDLTAADFVLAQSIDDKQLTPPQSFYYVRTKAHDPNGQYGRMLPVDRVADTANPVYCPDGRTPVDHALLESINYGEHNVAHELGTALECTFTQHSWKAGGASDAFREYVSWLLGGDVIRYSVWMAGGGQAVEKWILDDRDTTNVWAYWGAAVPPQGHTSNLLQSVKLEKQPDGDFFYLIHVDMQAVDYAGLDGWEDDNKDVVDALRNAKKGVSGVTVSGPTAATASATAATTLSYEALVSGVGVSQNVTWSITEVGGSGASINPVTGVLTIPAGYAGTITVVATSEDDDSKSGSITLTVAEAPAPNLDMNLIISSYTPSRPDGNDRVFFTVQDRDPDTLELYPRNERIMYVDDEAASWRSGVTANIEIPLSSIIATGQGITLSNVTVTNIVAAGHPFIDGFCEDPFGCTHGPCPGHSYTSSDVFIQDGKLISRCLMSFAEYDHWPHYNYDTNVWELQIPVIVTLTDSVTGKHADFTINNMYIGG